MYVCVHVCVCVSAWQYIYSYCDKFTKSVWIVKQYLKTGLSVYWLCYIIALVFYEVGNKKTTIPV